MARGDLTDRQWERISYQLPIDYYYKRKKWRRKPGRGWGDHRPVLNGILWVLRTGAPWEDLPARYGSPKTCWDRFARWKRDGTWDRILRALQAQAEDDEAIEWDDCALDGSYVRAHQHAAGARKRPEAAPTEETAKGGTQRA